MKTNDPSKPSRTPQSRGERHWFAAKCLHLLFVVPVLLALAPEAFAVTYPLRWRWSNPRPHGGNVVDMTYWSAHGVAVQVAERGQIFVSGELSFWIPVESGTTNDLRAVALMGNRLLITGENGCVLYAERPDEIRFSTVSPATTDWLEAVASSGALAVAVGDNGAIYASATGTNWTRRSSGNSQWLRGVAWGPSGGFVAVGENGTVMNSFNATAWFPRSSPISNHLNRVVFSAGRYTAVAEDGRCIYSFNGTNWFPEVSGASNDLFHTAATNAARVVVGDNEVRVQENGGPWSNELAQASGPAPWTYYASLPRQILGTSFLIAGRSGLMYEGTRGGAYSYLWTASDQRVQSARTWLWDVFYPTNLYVAVGDRATIMTSGNGVDWRVEVVPDDATNAVFLGVGGHSDMLVAVGSGGSVIVSPNIDSNNVVIVGTNSYVTNYSGFGVLWYAMNSKTTNDLQGIAASSNLFVATGAAGTIITSPDGTNWNTLPPLTGRFLSSVTAWPRGWIATGDDGVIVGSVNGTQWTVRSGPNVLTANWLYRVRYLGGRFIAVGQNGCIATSSDGSTWTKYLSTVTGTTKWLNDVAYVDGTYFVVGNGGTVLVSSDSSHWTNIGTITRKNLYGAATDGSQFITVGVEGAILRSQIVPTTTPMRILAYDHVTSTTPSGTVMQNIYLFGGQTDQRFTLDRRTAFGTNGSWVPGIDLEFFDGSGTLYYLETITTTNPPPKEFYRTTLFSP